jgi:hypothetical protein
MRIWWLIGHLLTQEKFMKKMLRVIAMMAIFIFGGTGFALAGTNLVKNPSFEEPFGINDWNSLGGATRASMVGGLLPTDGKWLLDLSVRLGDDYSGVNQVDLSGLVPSGTYQLNFDWAALSGKGAMVVSVGVYDVATFDVSGAEWHHYSGNFATPGGIAFSMYVMAPAGGEFLVDNVRLTPAVPEPETYAMMLVGLGLVSTGASWRRQKQKR